MFLAAPDSTGNETIVPSFYILTHPHIFLPQLKGDHAYMVKDSTDPPGLNGATGKCSQFSDLFLISSFSSLVGD